MVGNRQNLLYAECMEHINYQLIAIAAIVAISSPGPATLAIMGVSMSQGRRYGLVLAAGILTGSLFWSVSAAFGLAAIMHANVWLFEAIKYAGACYLIYLSYRSLRAAMANAPAQIAKVAEANMGATYVRGLLIHLTNPKAILFFAALYSLGVPAGIDLGGLLSVIFMLGVISATIFLGYAVLFSSSLVRHWYLKLRRFFEVVFAVLFGVAGFKLLAAKLSD